jgi:hypothetical protein
MTYPSSTTYPGSTTFPSVGVVAVTVQVEFVAGTWTTLPYVPTISGGRGRQYELATPQAGTMQVAVDCSDGNLDPDNTASPYYPNVKINKRARVQVAYAGVTKDIFTGFIERYPQRWTSAGAYQWTDLTIVDAFSPLGKTKLDPIAYHTINRYNPVAWWALDDAADSTVAGSRVGGPALTETTTNRPGTTGGPFVKFGSPPATQVPGMEGTGAASFTHGDLYYVPPDMTVLSSPLNRPPLPTTGAWTIYCSWTSTSVDLKPDPSNDYPAFPFTMSNFDHSIYVQMGVSKNNKTEAVFILSTTTGPQGGCEGAAGLVSGGVVVAGPFYDVPACGKWNNGLAHYSAISLSADYKQVSLVSSDSGARFTFTNGDGSTFGFSSIDSFSVGGEIIRYKGGADAAYPWPGTINNVTVFGADIITTGGIADIATAETLGYAGDDTAARFTRYMKIARPDITSAGSASGNSKVQPPIQKGKTLAAVLSDNAADEFGTLFVDGSGTVTFVNRSSRYNPAPTVTLTDQGADGPGVYRYTILATDYDDQKLLNTVEVKRNNGVTARSVDNASVTANGTYSTSVTVNITDDQQAIDRAAYTAGRYAQPATRISSITLSPGSDAALWPLVTALDLNQAVTVVRTPALGHASTRVCWVEKIDYSADATAGTFTMTLQLSPADVNSYLILDDPVRGKLDSGNRLAY